MIIKRFTRNFLQRNAYKDMLVNVPEFLEVIWAERGPAYEHDTFSLPVLDSRSNRVTEYLQTSNGISCGSRWPEVSNMWLEENLSVMAA